MLITTESSTRMNSFLSKDIEIKNKIMATDIYIKLISNTKCSQELESDINICIEIFKEFEKKYSRFIPNNLLDKFNNSTKGILDKEFLDIITKSKELNKETNNIFDIGVLPILKNEGYQISKKKGYYNKEKSKNKFISASLIDIIDKKYKKPLELKIDLGGIGKGFVVDKITNILRKKDYTNFIVDAGGDIRFEGKNEKENMDYWICGISNPNNDTEDLLLLKLFNKSIATSGVNKRVWRVNNKVKNHLINLKYLKSVNTDILTCSVISDNVTDADVYAKSLLIMDLKEALRYSDKKKIPVLFINKNNNIIYNNFFKEYIYEI